MDSDYRRFTVSFPNDIFDAVEEYRHQHRFSTITGAIVDLCRVALKYVEGNSISKGKNELTADENVLVEAFGTLDPTRKALVAKLVNDYAALAQSEK